MRQRISSVSTAMSWAGRKRRANCMTRLPTQPLAQHGDAVVRGDLERLRPSRAAGRERMERPLLEGELRMQVVHGMPRFGGGRAQ